MINKEALQKKVHVLGENESLGQTIQLVSIDSGYDDEISLIDLWLVLVKRRNILLAIVLAFLAAGVTFALVKPVVYNYSAVLQIGLMTGQDGENQTLGYIESPVNVLEKLSKSYIPLVLSDYLSSHPDIQSAPKVTAKMSKKSDLITIETRGKDTDAVAFKGLLNSTMGYIQKDHQPQMDITRGQYERSLQRANIALAMLKNPLVLEEKKKDFKIELLQIGIELDNLKDKRLTRVVKQQLITQVKEQENKLAALADNYKRLNSELTRLDDVDELLEKRIAELSVTIKNELTSRQASVDNINSGPEAMTVLLLDNQIQSHRNQLAVLEERLDIKQDSQREKIYNQLKENKRSQDWHQKLLANINNKLEKIDIDNRQAQQKLLTAQSSLELGLEKMLLEHENKIIIQQQKIDNITYKLKALRDTLPLTKPLQSIEPVGMDKKIIVIISLLAGLFVGVFSVFFLEFLSKIKEKSQPA